MKTRTKIIAAGALAIVIAGGTAGIVAASSSDDANDTPITGTALEHATAVALKETGGGKVTGTEVGDEEGYYEVEVTLDDGHQVDVHLDDHFNVLQTKPDKETDTGSEDEDEG